MKVKQLMARLSLMDSDAEVMVKVPTGWQTVDDAIEHFNNTKLVYLRGRSGASKYMHERESALPLGS